VPSSIPLRPEQPPDDAVVVIRGGLLGRTSVEQTARRLLRLNGMLGISVEGAIGVSVLDACQSSRRLAPYRRIRLSTFGRLRAAGFALLATHEHPHFTLVLSDLSELTIARLDRCFDDPIPNPASGPRG
jgi:hypothetical protein